MVATFLALVILGAAIGAIYALQRHGPQLSEVIKGAIAGGVLFAILFLVVKVLIIFLSVIALAVLVGLVVLALGWLLQQARGSGGGRAY